MNVDSLSLTSAAFFAALTAVTWAAMPAMDRTREQVRSLLAVVLGTTIALFSGSLAWFLVGWTITALPYIAGWHGTTAPGKSSRSLPGLCAGTSVVALAAGTWLATTEHSTAAFAALTLAVLLRKGVFPFHSWVAQAMENGPLASQGLFLNAQLGLFLLIRFAIPMLPEPAQASLPFLSILALLTSLYAAVLALAETAPRRILGLLCVSQASFVLAGLENRNAEGITGALVQAFAVAAATTGLLTVYRALEARYPDVRFTAGHLGLANTAPRLAVFFALCGLALIGLPGTLGFAAEDLLFHGSLESHPLLGITLPLATALNGITIFRLFTTLFLGRAAKDSVAITDALPAERWSLTATSAFLVITGIAPALLIGLRSAHAEQLARLLGGN